MGGVLWSRPLLLCVILSCGHSLLLHPLPRPCPAPCRLLVSVMEESQNSVAIAVACHDVGEYVRHNPRGKR